MKTYLRIFALILALLMIVPLAVACGKKKNEGEENAEATTGGVVDPSGEYVSKLPDTYDWDEDTCDVLGRDTGFVAFQNFEIWRENMPGDVVGDAVWERNEILRKKYNFLITQNLVENVATEVQTLYEAQDDVYDIVIYQPQAVQSHASSGFLLDLNSMMYIDLEHPSWNDYANEQLTIAGKLFYTTSDFLLQDKSRTFCMFYNRELARDNDLGYLEDHVKDNTWTLEYVNTIIHPFAAELDGMSGHSKDDGFGIAVTGERSFSALCYGAGFRVSENINGVPTLVEPSMKIIDIIDQVGKFAFDRTVWLSPTTYECSDSDVFCAGNTLLYSCFPSVLESKLNYACHFEFGILPNPKYDSTQDRYITQINIMNGSLFAVPYTVSDPSRTGFYLEALTEYSTDTTYDAFIETKCKVQDAYDELAAEMLDLTIQNVAYDIVAICGYGGIFQIVGDQIPSFGANVYSRLWDAKAPVAQAAIDQIILDYQSQ